MSVGVAAFSIFAGAICRASDVVPLANGTSAVAMAVLVRATFWGPLTFPTTVPNIALFSGGLLLAPALAAMLTAAERYLAGKSFKTA